MVKILFLAANPHDTSKLRLDQECRALSDKLKHRSPFDEVELVTRWAVRTSDVATALLEENPAIVHFSGHGRISGLVLEDQNGEWKGVCPEALVALFEAIGGNTRLALFNACNSLPVARASAEVLGASIGMDRPIGDESAIEFSAAFYQAISFGRTLQASFDAAIAELKMSGSSHASTPQLCVKLGVDASSLTLVAEKTGVGIDVKPTTGRRVDYSEAIDLYREKLAVLTRAWAIETDPAIKFKLDKQIIETKRELQQLLDH